VREFNLILLGNKHLTSTQIQMSTFNTRQSTHNFFRDSCVKLIPFTPPQYNIDKLLCIILFTNKPSILSRLQIECTRRIISGIAQYILIFTIFNKIISMCVYKLCIILHCNYHNIRRHRVFLR